jgi:hypothetical protein
MAEGRARSQPLAGRTVAVSVSNSSDLGRLGLTAGHLRLALGEIARSVFVAGGNLAYGGHLQAQGFTPFLVDELMRWERPRAGADRPGDAPLGPQLFLCLPWTVQRETQASRIQYFEEVLGAYGRVICLTVAGEEDPSWWRGRDEDPAPSPEQSADALTGMRRWMTRNTSGRVLVGGKRAGFQGRYPGLMEEALFALEAEQPVYLAGGFGGVTLDLVNAIDSDVGLTIPDPSGATMPVDERLLTGMEKLRELVAGRSWTALHNGLTNDENRQLAITHRPSEIAALITRGMRSTNPQAG